MKRRLLIAVLALLALPAGRLCAQQLVRSGQVSRAGHAVGYLVRHLPVNAFPELPAAVRTELERRGCLIPQTYEAHRPENVIHASLRDAGSNDWAVLCAVQDSVSLLVFLDTGGEPAVLATAPETERLQPHDASGVLGFDWGIDPATPEQVHQAQAGLQPRPLRLDHDALADSILERRTRYRFFTHGVWTLVELPD